MKASVFDELMALNLSTEQLAGVMRILSRELAPLDNIRASAAQRQARRRSVMASRDNHVTPCRDDAVTPRAVENLTSIQTTDNSGITPLNPPSLLLEAAEKFHVETLKFPDGFEAFWDAYPKRAGGKDKPGAVKAYKAALKRRAQPDQIAAGARAYAAYCASAGKIGTEFVLQARTWLNRNGWDDEYEQPNQPRGNRSNIASILRG